MSLLLWLCLVNPETLFFIHLKHEVFTFAIKMFHFYPLNYFLCLSENIVLCNEQMFRNVRMLTSLLFYCLLTYSKNSSFGFWSRFFSENPLHITWYLQYIGNKSMWPCYCEVIKLLLWGHKISHVFFQLQHQRNYM